MAAITAAAAGDFNTPATWNDPGGGARVPTAGDTANPNGYAITINGNVTCDGFVSSENVGYFAVNTSCTITLAVSGIVSSSTLTAGFVRVATGVTLDLIGGGAGKTLITQGPSGNAIVTAGTAALTVTNTNGVAMTVTSTTGRAVLYDSTGNLTVTGSISSSGGSSRTALYITGACTAQLNSDISNSGNTGYPTVYVGDGTVTINGNLGGTQSGLWCLQVNGGTVNWTGARSLVVDNEAYIRISGGTLTLATAGEALALANSGTVFIWKTTGTLNTADAGADAAKIVNQSATSYAAILGGTADNRSIITGASIPSAADTRYGVTRGWADGGTAKTDGCGVAGGNGLIQMPNDSAPTGTEDTTSDALVKDGMKYGSTPREGTYAGGGYTWGDSVDQGKVLTTATGAGTYQPVAAADVRAGTGVGVSPAVGTLAVPIAGDVRFGEDVDATTGTCYVPAAADVRFGTDVDATTGTAYIPAAADVQFGVNVDATTGTFTSPAVGKVISDTSWGAGGVEFTGTYHPTLVAEVLDSVSFGALSAETGTYHAPEAAEVISTAVFGPASGTPGTYDVSDVAEGNIIVGASIGGVAGTYPLTATTQAADAAILEAEKAYLLATKTITFGASSVVGTLAVGNVLTAVTGGTYVVPVVGQVLAPAQGGTAYGAGSGTSGTLTFADTTYVLSTAPDYGIAGTGGAKTATLPATSVVLTEAWGGPATYGVAGTGSTPQATLTLGDNVAYGSGQYGKFGALLTPNFYAPSDIAGVTESTTFGVGNAQTGTYHEATVAEVKAGVMFGGGELLEGVYSPGGTFVEGQASIIAALVLPATDKVDAPEMYGVNLAGYEAYYLEGMGVNSTTIRTALGLASANLDTQLEAIPTQQEVRDAMKLAPTAGDPAAGSVDKHLDDIATDVAGLDGAAMRGTDGAYTGTPPTADAIGTDAASKVLVTPSQKLVTNASGQVSASNVLTGAEMFAAILTTQMTEAYAADGVAPTLAQAIFLIQQSLHEFAIAATSRTVKKLDKTTTAAVFTLDDADAPTSTTRAS